MQVLTNHNLCKEINLSEYNSELPNYRVSIDVASALINAGITASRHTLVHIHDRGKNKDNAIVYSPKQNHLWCVAPEECIEISEDVLLPLALIPTPEARLLYLNL